MGGAKITVAGTSAHAVVVLRKGLQRRQLHFVHVAVAGGTGGDACCLQGQAAGIQTILDFGLGNTVQWRFPEHPNRALAGGAIGDTGFKEWTDDQRGLRLEEARRNGAIAGPGAKKHKRKNEDKFCPLPIGRFGPFLGNE